MILVIEPFYQSIFSDAGYAKGVVVTSTGGANNKYSKKFRRLQKHGKNLLQKACLQTLFRTGISFLQRKQELGHL